MQKTGIMIVEINNDMMINNTLNVYGHTQYTYICVHIYDIL